jgi:hypothetical protein
MPAAEPLPFAYAILRVVPRVERGESINAGVVLFARQHRFLDARVRLDQARLSALAPACDPSPIERHLDALARVARGEPGAGPVASMEPSERFNWLVAPASTIVQPGPVHTGLTEDPAGQLDRLFEELVGLSRSDGLSRSPRS